MDFPSVLPAKSSPLVSVVMLSYNHDRFVGEAARSVLEQSMQDFELIVVDDCSTDSSWGVLSSFDDPRVRLFRNSKNKGIAVSRDLGIEQARGQYIAIFNSDDRFLPDKLDKQVYFLQNHPDVAAVTTYVRPIDETGQLILEHPYHELFRQANRSRYQWLNHFFLHGNCLAHPSALIRRKCYSDVGIYDPRLFQMSDFDFWVRLCLQKDIWIVPEQLTEFRILNNNGNVSSNTLEHQMRSQWEFAEILPRFFAISTLQEFDSIFPGNRSQLDDDHVDLIPFLLARLALKVNHPCHRLFALQTIHRLMADPQKAKRIDELLGFEYRDLIALTGTQDIFGLQNATAIQSQLQERLASREAELRSVLDSKSWHVTRPLRCIARYAKAVLTRKGSLF